MKDKLFGFLQKILPQHLLTQIMGLFANSQITWLKNFLIRTFIYFYPVNMHEAVEENPFAYASFNAFFTRKLKQQCRQIDAHIVSPADSIIYQFGEINNGTLLQAKGKLFSLTELVGSEDWAAPYQQGKYLTLYLAPQFYHRVHIPYDSQLTSMRHIAGKLFSVNTASLNEIPNLFSRNERVIFNFESAIGKFTVIMIGAFGVGSIHTEWAGKICAEEHQPVSTWEYAEKKSFNKGDELGFFSMGSSVIVLLENNKIAFTPELTVEKFIPVGKIIAKINSSLDGTAATSRKQP